MSRTSVRENLSTLPARSAQFLSSWSNVAFLVVMVVLVVTHGVVFFATLVISPIGFDEAFNLQAPLNLIQGNGYSTEDWMNGGEKLTFDAIVSTGPIVEVPAALTMLLFGVSVEAARIVMLPYYVLLLVCLYILGRRIGGRWAGALAVLSVLALNSRADWPTTVIYGPSDALGEYAAASLIALALVIVPTHRRLAGLVIGFAALAKFIAFMAAPAFMIALLLVPVVRGTFLSLGARLRELVVFAFLVALPSIGWELVKFVSLGWDGYLESLLSYLRFVFRSGSGVDGSGRAFFLDRLSRLFAAWHLPTLLIIVLTVVLFVFVLIALWQIFAKPRADLEGVEHPSLTSFLRWSSRASVSLWAAAGTLGVFVLWWSFVASSIFVRHTMPVLVAIIPILIALAFAGALWTMQHRSRVLRVLGAAFVVGMVAVLLVQSTLTVSRSFQAEQWTRGEQNDAAAFVRSLDVDDVQGIGWWASPDIRFLSQVPSQPIGTGTGPLILSPITKELEPATWDFAFEFCVDILYDQDGYIICTVRDDITPLDYTKPLVG